MTLTFFLEKGKVVPVGIDLFLQQRKHLPLGQCRKEQAIFHFVVSILGLEERFEFPVSHERVLRFVLEVPGKFLQLAELLLAAKVLEKSVFDETGRLAGESQVWRGIVSVEDKGELAVCGMAW